MLARSLHSGATVFVGFKLFLALMKNGTNTGCGMVCFDCS